MRIYRQTLIYTKAVNPSLAKTPLNFNGALAKLGLTSFVKLITKEISTAWWRHQMETFTALLALCMENSPVTGDFPSQRPVTRSFDVFFDLRLNKRLSKQWWGWWFETLSRPLWRHCNGESLVSYWSIGNWWTHCLFRKNVPTPSFYWNFPF